MQLATYKFSIEQYHQMLETETLPLEQRFELIRGNIVTMSPIGSQHAAAVNRLTQLFSLFLGKKAIVAIQNPLGLPDDSEPQPDVAIYKPRADFYETQAPTNDDVYLLVEVAKSTLRYDQQVKLPLYIENKILEVWIVTLQERQLEIYREPDGSGYAQKVILKDTDTLAPLAFPEVAIAVKDIFG